LKNNGVLKTTLGGAAGCISGRTFRIAIVATFCLAAAATVAIAAEGGHEGVSPAQLKDFGWRLLNFAIVAAILIWAAKKAKVRDLLAGRRKEVERLLVEANEARAAAERKLVEQSEKLDKASKEIDDIYAAIKQEAEAEKKRILAEAETAAARIKEQAAAAARQETRKATTELREEAARLSVQLAAETLRARVEKSDQDRFVNEFIEEYQEKVEKPH
jgi:F-type H+-transporting ATPase subunit b